MASFDERFAPAEQYQQGSSSMMRAMHHYIDSSFPPQGQEHCAHEGSQSDCPTKELP